MASMLYTSFGSPEPRPSVGRWAWTHSPRTSVFSPSRFLRTNSLSNNQQTPVSQLPTAASKQPTSSQPPSTPTPTSLLFPTNTSPQNQARSSPPSTPPRPGMGYFAFPSGSPPPVLFTSSFIPPPFPRTPETPKPHSQPARPQSRATSHDKTSSFSSPSRPQAKTKSPTRDLEEAEARRGEDAWVASGGFLYDKRGNIDYARTNKVRAELELRAKERKIMQRWEEYEDAWLRLGHSCRSQCQTPDSNSKGKGKKRERVEDEIGGKEQAKEETKDLGFADIPWPVSLENGIEQPKRLTMSVSLTSQQSASLPTTLTTRRVTPTLQDLTVDRVEAFLLAPLSVRGCTSSFKSRLRSCLLRWHPDKMGRVMNRVREEEREDVRAGVVVVLECLQRLRQKQGVGERELDASEDSGKSRSSSGVSTPAAC
ncbi:hypothetical protein AMATHDRAFT_71013 [Amanita thiersii Skay4041]|uniref:Uncharacterized protein n=1 Tax=Amanita thiersii Skay4041 TaxID=703135 RepID=A0A2A9N6R4_9AGAR|nr:hypothetical protein AMATHDRAFT_71013 [Amanita thiersii Skay4041]